MNLIAFSSAAFLTWLAFLAVGVFWLGQFDQAYGSQGTAQVGLLFGLAATTLATASFAIATKILGRLVSPLRSFILGSGCSAAFFLLAGCVASMTRNGTLPVYGSASIALLCGAIAALFSSRAADAQFGARK
jgi:hypothetical protein